MKLKDGRWEKMDGIAGLFRYKPLLDEAGRIFRWFCTATDIEDLKRADERLRLVVDTTPALLHSARPDGYLDYLNVGWTIWAFLWKKYPVGPGSRQSIPKI